MKFPGIRNFSTLSKLSGKSLEVAPPYYKYTRHKTHKTLLISLIRYTYCPIIFSWSNLGQRILNNSNMLFVLQTHANAKTLEAEQNWYEWYEWNYGMNGIIFFSAKFFVYLSALFPAYLFAVRGRLQRWKGWIKGTSKIPIS